jgi:hypothetical protein
MQKLSTFFLCSIETTNNILNDVRLLWLNSLPILMLDDLKVCFLFTQEFVIFFLNVFFVDLKVCCLFT